MARPSSDDLSSLVMQVAHAFDMVNHLPDPDGWNADPFADNSIDSNQLRLLTHAARESWAINARLLSQFFLGDKHGIDATDYLPDWAGHEAPVLGAWRSVASEHVAHLSPRRARDPVRALHTGERQQVKDAINREAFRFASELNRADAHGWGRAMTDFLAGLHLDDSTSDAVR